ncbi:hypothetical protein AB0M34_11885 [Nocardia sp. NPDC050193]
MNAKTDAPNDLLQEHLAHYQRQCGLAATLDANRRIIVRAEDAGNVRMPQQLGERVHAALRVRSLATPIIVNQRGYWTFLTQSTPPNGQAQLFDPLFLHRAKRSVRGCTTTLPGPDDSMRAWLVEPVHISRLPLEAVAEITLEIAGTTPPVRI